VECRELLRVEELIRTRMIGVVRARPPPALPDLGARLLKHLLVGSVLPLNEPLDDLEEAFSLLLLLGFGWKELGNGRRVVHHLREDHRTSRR